MFETRISRREFLKYSGGAAAGAALLWLPRIPGLAADEAPEYLIRNLAAPLYSNPAMIKAGGAFAIKMKTPECRLLGAALRGADGKPYELKVTQEGEKGLSTAASGAPPGLYDLEVKVEDAAGARVEAQKKSVCVFSEFKKTFDFVFVSDIHFGGAETREVAVSEADVYKCRRWGLSEIGKYKPEFILVGGDLALYPPGYRFAYPEGFAFLTRYLDRPVHIIPGNHDVYQDDVEELGEHVRGKEYWEKYYGEFYHSFDYGTLHFTCLNTSDWPDEYIEWGTQDSMWGGTLLNAGISREQFEWMKADLEAAAPRSTETVIVNHIPLTWTISGTKKGFPPVKLPGAPLDRMVKLMEDAGVRYSFAGHVHMNQDNRLSDRIEEKVFRNIGGKFMESDKAGFAVIHVSDGRISGIERIDMPA